MIVFKRRCLIDALFCPILTVLMHHFVNAAISLRRRLTRRFQFATLKSFFTRAHSLRMGNLNQTIAEGVLQRGYKLLFAE